VLRAVLYDTEDTTTKISVLTSNKTEEDILCRKEMESYLKTRPFERYRIHHALTRVPSSDTNWKGSRGRISEQMLKEHLPTVSDQTLILICGPDGMIETVKRCLTNIGWDIEKSLVVF
jgi:nitrate reductase (NAD(P)H)